jgi:hypothetical protein
VKNAKTPLSRRLHPQDRGGEKFGNKECKGRR